ncbi:hypothetical protein NHX12_009159 [Muraenolepis orangiensis]|uniref:TLC domain-containing protein n=1 Tax=Muraenolepis orangiensis TaxID=630683 RepID=A0A9Q0DRB9_9TELE|nr:hypothetical protein NHX12_009159 [Muraenolepis orangiensis]
MERLQDHPGPVVLVFSLLFRVVHRLLQNLPVPKVVRADDFRAWKWRNLSVSMVHSLLTAAWALSCVMIWPETIYNIYSFYRPLSYILICLSTGYFVQDALDIILSGYAKGSWEFLAHHALVLVSFSYTLYSKLYVSGAVVALFVEFNSLTLHARLMMKMSGVQDSPAYRINKVLNLLTFVGFRLVAQAYLTWYIVHHYETMRNSGFFLSCMVTIDAMILGYFYRLLRADFFPRAKRPDGAVLNGTHTGKTQKFLTD